MLIVDFELSKTGAFKVTFCLLSQEYCNQENFKLKYKYLNYYETTQEQVMGELGLDPLKIKIYRITINITIVTKTSTNITNMIPG